METASLKRCPSPSVPESLQMHMQLLQKLPPDKVRWFYKEEKKWIPFDGADSLLIEDAWRLLGGAPQNPGTVLCAANVTIIGEVRPVVRGCLYEVDISKKVCTPLYWKESPVKIMRGTWFKGSTEGAWAPVEENYAEKIEEAHHFVVRSLGKGSSDLALSPSSPVIHHIRVGMYRVEWHDISEAFIISESTGSKLAQKIGFAGAVKLHRGYSASARTDDKPMDINHIVFLVHGMGQLWHREGGIVHSRKRFRETVDVARKRFFDKVKLEGRMEFFPIEWRSSLRLDEGVVNSITPCHLESLRKVMNETMMDVMYYASPLYKDEIMQAMREQLNSIYAEYCSRNPEFERKGGKVSVIAHSLGSVIIHDVLTQWNSCLLEKNSQQGDELTAEERSSVSSRSSGVICEYAVALSQLPLPESEGDLSKQLQEARLRVADIEAKLLDSHSFISKGCKLEDIYCLRFKVETVFNIGSPLGVFLAMRGIRPRLDVEQHILPTSVCKRIYNVYDPADPIAYRLEPLIYEHYGDVPPVRLAHFAASSVVSKRHDHWGAAQASWLKGLFSRLPVAAQTNVEFSEDFQVSLPSAVGYQTEESHREKKVLRHRLDFVLEEPVVEYFSAITSHQSYWSNLDFARFVIGVLASDEPE